MSVHIQPYRIMPSYRAAMPLCSLVLLGRQKRVTLRALVDTGALYSVFPTKAAEDAELELPTEPNQWLQSASDTVPAYRAKCYIMLLGRRIEIEAAFVERLEAPFALLGRVRVFSRFREIAFAEGRPDPHIRFTWK